MAAAAPEAVAPPAADSHVSDTAVANRGLNEHGCEHYRRRCKIVAPCCGEVFWCRHCHNAVKHDSEQDQQKRHQVDRKAVSEVVCALCSTRQPVACSCTHCGVSFGRYTCMECRFFEDDVSKEQFHCEHCGICRVGGKDNYFHCPNCACCYSVQLRDSHTCIQNSMHQNCPVCFEYLFDSTRSIAVMPCGHTIHQACQNSLMDHHTYTCPICLKSFLPPESLEGVWQQLDSAIQRQPMPEEYAFRQVRITCNDCRMPSTVQFHFIGHKCRQCGGYNTRRV